MCVSLQSDIPLISAYCTNHNTPQQALFKNWTFCRYVFYNRPIMAGESIKIEFLFWEECPSHGTAWERLQGILKEKSLRAQVARIEIKTEEDAKQWNFCGSPTIRINGEDIDMVGAQAQRIGLNCRIYHTPDGRVTPVPSEEMIRKAIDSALK
jgi:hypothetical protein